jgi:hypothetical protein
MLSDEIKKQIKNWNLEWAENALNFQKTETIFNCPII